MSFGDAVLYSVTGLLVVFFALILIMLIIKIMLAVGDRKKPVPAPAAAAEAPAAPVSREIPPSSEGRYTRELKLYDTDSRDAAMIMAIVADATQIPLNQLQFISIREIKEDEEA
jgi:Na+-transporting methylmalonyl-CoA/oxaloacetate decarboxylase gamma subunit